MRDVLGDAHPGYFACSLVNVPSYWSPADGDRNKSTVKCDSDGDDVPLGWAVMRVMFGNESPCFSER